MFCHLVRGSRILLGLVLTLEVWGEGFVAFDDQAFEQNEAVLMQDWEERFAAAQALLAQGDHDKAIDLIRKLSIEGHPKSQHQLGAFYLNGLGVRQSRKRGEQLIRSAAEAKFAPAMSVWASWQFAEDRRPEDFARALEYLEMLVLPDWDFGPPLDDPALERNLRAEAAYYLGWLCLEGSDRFGFAHDRPRGVGLLRDASDKGVAAASMFLALVYAKGDGVERDLEESKRRFELADLQSFDTVRRRIEELSLGNLDPGARKELEKTVRELAELHSQQLQAGHVVYALAILDEAHADYDPAAARALLKMGAEAGSMSAQYHYGRLLAMGIGGEKDLSEAKRWLEKASAQGWVLADYGLGMVMLNGEGENRDEVGGRRLLDKAADSGFYVAQLILDGEHDAKWVSDEEDLRLCEERRKSDPRAAYAYAMRQRLGWLVPPQPVSKRMRKVLKKGAEAGYMRSQFAYGSFYYWGWLEEQDLDLALKYFQKAADQGHGPSYFKLGYIYEKGFGSIKRDPVKAVANYERSYEQGDAWAANNLGAIYSDGDLGEKDYEKAIQYYEEAMKRGANAAYYNIAQAYQYGNGRPVDMKLAREWFEKGAEEGDLESAQKLLALDKKGQIELEEDELAYWLEKCAELGDVIAMRRISRMYFKGTGVPRSPTLAYKWRVASLSSGPIVNRQEGLLALIEILMVKDWAGHDLEEAAFLSKKLSSEGILESVRQRARLFLARIFLEKDYEKRNPRKAVSLFKTVNSTAKDVVLLLSEQKSKPGVQIDLNGYSRNAATIHIAESAFYMSQCYGNGVGVKRDPKREYKWLSIAHETGKHASGVRLATWEVIGHGTEAKPESGTAKLVKLAENGDAKAALALADLVLDGVLAANQVPDLEGLLRGFEEKGNLEARRKMVSLGFNPTTPTREETEPDGAPEFDPRKPVTLG